MEEMKTKCIDVSDIVTLPREKEKQNTHAQEAHTEVVRVELIRASTLHERKQAAPPTEHARVGRIFGGDLERVSPRSPRNRGTKHPPKLPCATCELCFIPATRGIA